MIFHFQTIQTDAWMSYGQFMGMGTLSFIALLAWSLVWKGIALWKSARHGSKKWFVALLIINTAGILEILYIYIFSKKHKKANLTAGQAGDNL